MTELSGVDLARQTLVAAREAAKKNGATDEEAEAAHRCPDPASTREQRYIRSQLALKSDPASRRGAFGTRQRFHPAVRAS